MQQYFKELEDKAKVVYSIAEQAREKGLDPISRVEIPLASTLAERVTGLISTIYPQIRNSGIEKRIRDLEKEYGLLDPAVALTIAQEISKEKFCKFKSLLEAIDAGIRVAFAYITLGVVSSPIEGFTHFKLGKTKDNQDYFVPYFSGPIRSAGTTASCVALLIIDHLREILGYAKYDPTEQEIRRTVTELYDYHERITNLQYLPTEEEAEFLARHLPLQVSGEPSEKKEVSNYKDLPRIETNFIRGGFCLILGEGLAQKAPKALKIMKKLREKGFKLTDWDFLEEYVKIHEKRQKGKAVESPTYINDIVAGRPVLGHPSRSGSFRLRYGRARTTGYSALAIHPATMIALDEFIAMGTQLKIELPTKGAAMTSCDSIEGPIVKLKDDSVVRINDLEKAKHLQNEIKEIIYLGDILIPYGDFANRNHLLMPAGYNEEYWLRHLEKKEQEKNEKEKIDARAVSIEKAIELSKKYEIPLHPNYIFYWTQIPLDFLENLLEWLYHMRLIKDELVLPYKPEEKEKLATAKRALELIGAEHTVNLSNNEVIIHKETSTSLMLNLGINYEEEIAKQIVRIKEKLKQEKEKNEIFVLPFVNKISKFEIKDKAGTFVGSRMGRPEKAKLRKLIGSPHVLFPVGDEGGRLRSVQEASKSIIEREFPVYYCKNCKSETIYYVCEKCGKTATKLFYCPTCARFVDENEHIMHKLQGFARRKIDMKHYLDSAMNLLSFNKEEMPVLIKGVRGTSSSEHVPEHLAKGILRAKYGIHVNKDGTIRYDCTELPITHFKPCEIRTPVETLKNLGYHYDIHDKPLVSDDQILELKPQDIILPSCSKTLDEKADDVFIKVTKFIDNLLVRFYGLQPFYNVDTPQDLVGHIMLCMAPHNCAGVAGRIIGFSEIQALLASPYIHAAMRRDCDGDEAAVMLLMDALLNFSRSYLPAHRGGTQDAPLVLNIRIRAGEVDDMIFDVDVASKLPLELYEAAEQNKHPSTVKIEQIKDRLNGNEEFKNLHFTHDTCNINFGTICSAYKTLGTMAEKVSKQMGLVEKIRAVNESDVARLVIERHFIRDIRGNLRKFSTQQFRCVKCNEKYRRPPLIGKCLKCNGKIIFTIAEGSIKKYLEPAIGLANKYNVPSYIKQSLELTKSNIESIFGKETEKQQELKQWFKSPEQAHI